jgi:hypothetical protein
MSQQPNDQDAPSADEQQVIVVGPDGRPVGSMSVPPPGDSELDDAPVPDTVADLVNQPAKVMRIGSMVKQLLEEVRGAALDDAGRTRLRQIHERSITELEAGLAPELVEELERISLPFSDDSVPSDAELRIAQAQLVGWLEGLFAGIQTALFAQQMAARQQLDEMRRHAALGAPHEDEVPPPSRGGPSGPYL